MKIENAIPADKKSNSEILVVISSFALSLALISFFSIPEYREARIIMMKKELMEKNLESKKEMLVKIQEFNNVNKDVSDRDLEKIYNILPDKDKVENYLASIYNLARANRILIDGLTVGKAAAKSPLLPPVDNKDIKSLNIVLTINGKFEDFASFLESLEKSIPMVNLDKLKIAKEEQSKNKVSKESGPEGEINVLKYDIEFIIYYF